MPFVDLPRTSPAPLLQLRLARLALLVRALVLVGALGLVAAFAWAWGLPGHALHEVQTVSGVCIDRLTPEAREAGALWSMLPLGVTLVALQRLWTLFGEYGEGRVFGRRALLCLRDFARCILAIGIVVPLHGGVLSVIATWANAPGQRQLNLEFSSNDYATLLLGAVLLAISGVMAEAARVADENAGFV